MQQYDKMKGCPKDYPKRINTNPNKVSEFLVVYWALLCYLYFR